MEDGRAELDSSRAEFLIAMYNQMMNDINRHIVVVWQSVGVLFGAFAVFALVEKQIIPLDIAATLILILCIWVIAHVYDASYWYNRNLVIIANIERLFLRRSDLRDVHYYFGKHRRAGAMITHLETQLWLAIGVAVVVLIVHFVTDVPPIWNGNKPVSILTALPWLTAAVGLIIWAKVAGKATRRYKTFLRNSPGVAIDASGIEDGPGHPT